MQILFIIYTTISCKRKEKELNIFNTLKKNPNPVIIHPIHDPAAVAYTKEKKSPVSDYSNKLIKEVSRNKFTIRRVRRPSLSIKSTLRAAEGS